MKSYTFMHHAAEQSNLQYLGYSESRRVTLDLQALKLNNYISPQSKLCQTRSHDPQLQVGKND